MENSDDVEADLARWYPRDADQLPAFYDGRMSLRRLFVLITRLPQASNTWRATEGELAEWTLEHHLLARIANLLLQANGQRAGKRVPDSQFINPPQTKAAPKKKKKEKSLTQAEFDALFIGG